MISFEVVYEQFLSFSSINFGEMTDEEIKSDLYSWVLLASSKFKFPRVNLDHILVKETNDNGDEEEKPYFKNDITQKEITVIVEHMNAIAIGMQLAEASSRDDYYVDANLKLPSQTARVTQLNRALENQTFKANRTENDYYRTENDKPTIGGIWDT